MVIQYNGRVGKGNSRGVGWLTLPFRFRNSFELGKYAKVRLSLVDCTTTELHLKISRNKKCWGFYIPKGICLKNNLIGNTYDIIIQNSNNFPITISVDKRIIIPLSIVNQNDMRPEDIWEVELEIGDQNFQEPVIISFTDRSYRNRIGEYSFTVRLNNIPVACKGTCLLIRKL